MADKGMPVLDTLGRMSTPVHLARSIIESTLADAILDGRIASGTPLRQLELAEVFGVSRMPVREALLSLQARGLVDHRPNKGAVVIEVDPADVINTYRIRQILEPEALAGSVPLLDSDDFARARACLEAMDGQPDLADLGRLNSEFHQSLYRRHPNAKLLRLITNELTDEDRYLRFHLAELGSAQLAQDEHRAMFDAAARGDVPGATEVLRRHISAAGDAIEAYFWQRSQS